LRQRHSTQSPLRSEFNFGAEDQERRHAIRRRRSVADIAGDSAAILDLDGADIPRRGLQRVEGGRQIRLHDVSPSGSRADPDGLVVDVDPPQQSQVRDIDEIA
jgi:hypothetical protein